MYTDNQKEEHIYSLQTYLRRIQVEDEAQNPLIPDGIWGPETQSAVASFQRSHYITPTGYADYETWEQIYREYKQLSEKDAPVPGAVFLPLSCSHTSVSSGDSGMCVYAIQLLLNSVLNHCTDQTTLPITGTYDADTEEAVRTFQKDALLPQTGITDKKTYTLLVLSHNAMIDHFEMCETCRTLPRNE